jgi:hypothetical protein
VLREPYNSKIVLVYIKGIKLARNDNILKETINSSGIDIKSI